LWGWYNPTHLISVGDANMNVKNIIWTILFTMIIALSALLIHEFWHLFIMYMQDPTINGVIRFDMGFFYGLPFPKTGFAFGGELTHLCKWAGGGFTGITFLLIGWWAWHTDTFQDYYVEFAFTLVGLCHLTYSFWEVFMLGKIPLSDYCFGANVIYCIVISIYIILERKNLVEYL